LVYLGRNCSFILNIHQALPTMYSIIQDLEKNVNTHPNKLLYAFLDIKGEIKESYTYQAFYNRTSVIAGGIYENSTLKSGDRVLLAYLPGLEMICAFFSCVRLGLILFLFIRLPPRISIVYSKNGLYCQRLWC
jgi:acyl-CoA synthetase (AMP-forming)/AMP-acid ligase II